VKESEAAAPPVSDVDWPHIPAVRPDPPPFASVDLRSQSLEESPTGTEPARHRDRDYARNPPTGLPAPLLAPLPDVQPAFAQASSAPIVAVGRSADSETATEVHVHIGRVELTAVTESQAPQRKPRPRPAARSLDDYLQQRKERLR
jgi:hypothetical protein